MTRNKKPSALWLPFMNCLISHLANNGQYRTMLHYRTTRNSFMRFRKGKDIAVKDIDAEEIRAYEATFAP